MFFHGIFKNPKVNAFCLRVFYFSGNPLNEMYMNLEKGVKMKARFFLPKCVCVFLITLVVCILSGTFSWADFWIGNDRFTDQGNRMDSCGNVIHDSWGNPSDAESWEGGGGQSQVPHYTEQVNDFLAGFSQDSDGNPFFDAFDPHNVGVDITPAALAILGGERFAYEILAQYAEEYFGKQENQQYQDDPFSGGTSTSGIHMGYDRRYGDVDLFAASGQTGAQDAPVHSGFGGPTPGIPSMFANYSEADFIPASIDPGTLDRTTDTGSTLNDLIDTFTGLFQTPPPQSGPIPSGVVPAGTILQPNPQSDAPWQGVLGPNTQIMALGTTGKFFQIDQTGSDVWTRCDIYGFSTDQNGANIVLLSPWGHFAKYTDLAEGGFGVEDGNDIHYGGRIWGVTPQEGVAQPRWSDVKIGQRAEIISPQATAGGWTNTFLGEAVTPDSTVNVFAVQQFGDRVVAVISEWGHYIEVDSKNINLPGLISQNTQNPAAVAQTAPAVDLSNVHFDSSLTPDQIGQYQQSLTTLLSNPDVQFLASVFTDPNITLSLDDWDRGNAYVFGSRDYVFWGTPSQTLYMKPDNIGDWDLLGHELLHIYQSQHGLDKYLIKNADNPTPYGTGTIEMMSYSLQDILTEPSQETNLAFNLARIQLVVRDKGINVTGDLFFPLGSDIWALADEDLHDVMRWEMAHDTSGLDLSNPSQIEGVWRICSQLDGSKDLSALEADLNIAMPYVQQALSGAMTYDEAAKAVGEALRNSSSLHNPTDNTGFVHGGFGGPYPGANSWDVPPPASLASPDTLAAWQSENVEQDIISIWTAKLVDGMGGKLYRLQDGVLTEINDRPSDSQLHLLSGNTWDGWFLATGDNPWEFSFVRVEGLDSQAYAQGRFDGPPVNMDVAAPVQAQFLTDTTIYAFKGFALEPVGTAPAGTETGLYGTFFDSTSGKWYGVNSAIGQVFELNKENIEIQGGNPWEPQIPGPSATPEEIKAYVSYHIQFDPATINSPQGAEMRKNYVNAFAEVFSTGRADFLYEIFDYTTFTLSHEGDQAQEYYYPQERTIYMQTITGELLAHEAFHAYWDNHDSDSQEPISGLAEGFAISYTNMIFGKNVDLVEATYGSMLFLRDNSAGARQLQIIWGDRWNQGIRTIDIGEQIVDYADGPLQNVLQTITANNIYDFPLSDKQKIKDAWGIWQNLNHNNSNYIQQAQLATQLTNSFFNGEMSLSEAIERIK